MRVGAAASTPEACALTRPACRRAPAAARRRCAANTPFPRPPPARPPARAPACSPVRNEAEGRRVWQFWQGYLSTPGNCIHGTKCAAKARGGPCVIGNALESRAIISGALLPVYKVLQETVERSGYGRNAENRKVDMPEVVRGVLEDGTPVVGAWAARAGGDVAAGGAGGG
jgi:hypothetical protein